MRAVSGFRTDFRGKERGARLGSTGCKGMDKAVEQLELPVLCTNYREAIFLFVLAFLIPLAILQEGPATAIQHLHPPAGEEEIPRQQLLGHPGPGAGERGGGQAQEGEEGGQVPPRLPAQAHQGLAQGQL